MIKWTKDQSGLGVMLRTFDYSKYQTSVKYEIEIDILLYKLYISKRISFRKKVR